MRFRGAAYTTCLLPYTYRIYWYKVCKRYKVCTVGINIHRGPCIGLYICIYICVYMYISIYAVVLL